MRFSNHQYFSQDYSVSISILQITKGYKCFGEMYSCSESVKLVLRISIKSMYKATLYVSHPY